MDEYTLNRVEKLEFAVREFEAHVAKDLLRLAPHVRHDQQQVTFFSTHGFSNFLRDFIIKEDIDEIVVGLPTLLDGKDSGLTPEAKEFARKIKDLTRMPVYFENEAFTSSAVDTQGAAPHGKSDASAAALILQSFLDRRNASNEPKPFTIKL